MAHRKSVADREKALAKQKAQWLAAREKAAAKAASKAAAKSPSAKAAQVIVVVHAQGCGLLWLAAMRLPQHVTWRANGKIVKSSMLLMQPCCCSQHSVHRSMDAAQVVKKAEGVLQVAAANAARAESGAAEVLQTLQRQLPLLLARWACKALSSPRPETASSLAASLQQTICHQNPCPATSPNLGWVAWKQQAPAPQAFPPFMEVPAAHRIACAGCWRPRDWRLRRLPPRLPGQRTGSARRRRQLMPSDTPLRT